MPDTIRHRNKATVSNGVAPLNRLPGCMLQFPVFSLFSGMPTDGGRIKKDLGALHRRQSSRFRIPLVPANQDTNFRIACLPCAKAQIAWRKVEFFVIKWIIGNMHFAVTPEQCAVGINDDCRVVVNTSGALFEQ